MKEVPKNLLFFIYITFILTSLIGLILITSGAPLFISSVTGKVSSGLVGLCVGVTPVISSIGNQEAFVGVEFYYDVEASAGSDNLSFKDDTTLFNINLITGEINFTPSSSDQGNETVRITVTNDACSGGIDAFEDVLFEIRSEPPVLDAIGSLNATEDTAFYYDVNASDPTDGDNASLVFSVNVTWFLINSTNGTIDFTPVNANVGDHIVRFTVTDPSGGQDYEDVNFTVTNVNDAPVLGEIPNFTNADGNPLTEDTAFYYDVNATDVDVGDVLVFSDDFATFVINEDNGVIQWTLLMEKR